MFIYYKLHVTVLVNTVGYSIDTILGEGKCRSSLKSNPMALWRHVYILCMHINCMCHEI